MEQCLGRPAGRIGTTCLRRLKWLTFIVLLSSGQTSFAAEIWQEYEKLIDKQRNPATMGADLFGDQVDLQTGALSFRTTDLSIPGNNKLPVALTRTYQIRSGNGFPDSESPPNDLHLGDWELALPRIEGVFPAQTGWVNANPSKGALRCSVANAAEASARTLKHDGVWFQGHELWHGTKMYLGDSGSPLLVARGGVQKPTSGTGYTWVTSAWTWVSCLDTIKNGTGQGFLAVTSDGTKYWFDHMAANGETSLTKPKESGVGKATLTRKRYALYVTRVEDRFGNWVAYHYGNTADQPVRLASIASSDNRTISLGYTGAYITSASDGIRTWHYGYSGSKLTTVTLPDNSQWGMSFAFKGRIDYIKGEPGEEWRDCYNPGSPMNEQTPATGSITHPSGAVAHFTMMIKRHERNVPTSCSEGGNPFSVVDDYSYYPNVWDAYTLTEKRVTGPGLVPASWTYAYGSNWTRVDDPDGDYSLSVFGINFKSDMGKLLSTTRYESDGTALRVERYVYQLDPAGQPYPAQIGDSGQDRSEDWSDEVFRPLKSRVVTQQGVTFSRVVDSFDSFGSDLQTTVFSSLGRSRTELKTYYHHTGLWVLGQVAKLVCTASAPQTALCDGAGADSEVSETTFDPASALPLTFKAHGKLGQAVTYKLGAGDQSGTVHTVTDGNGKTTTLSSWYRGVPTNVRYHDQNTQSATVDPRGLITSHVDENGYATGYGYDSMGRLASVVYPAEDLTAWNNELIAFEKVPHDEHGLPAGHWRSIRSVGNRRSVVFYDALWRPVVEQTYDLGDISNTISRAVKRYDSAGRLSFQSYPIRHLVNYWDVTQGMRTKHDALGRVVEVEQDSELGPLKTRTQYLSSFQTLVTNARNFQTTTGYDAYDEPSYELPPWVVSDLGNNDDRRHRSRVTSSASR